MRPTLLFLLLFSPLFLIGQNIRNYQVDNSDLIVEGEIISVESFMQDGYIYTINYIKRKASLKGKSRTEKLCVITKGGEYGEIKQTVTHSLTLNIGDIGIFFLNSVSNKYQVLNNLEVYEARYGFFKLSSSYTEKLLFGEHLYKKAVIYDEISSMTNEEVRFENYEERANDCVDLTLVPFTIDDINRQTDIYNYSLFISKDEGNKLLESVKFNVIYNENVLGSSIITNEILNFTLGSSFDPSDYMILAEDVSNNSFSLEISKRINGTPLTINQILKEILKIELNSNNEAGLFHLFSSIEESSFEIRTRENLSSPPLEECATIKIDTRSTCFLEITGVTPDEVSAGVLGESLNDIPGIITITGEFFGNHDVRDRPLANRVYFFNADNANLSNDIFDISNYEPIAELEYLTWSDTEIVVQVPTVGINGGSLTSATGFVAVSTDDCNGEICFEFSPNPITIKFGTFNDRWNRTIEWDSCDPVTPANFNLKGGKRRNLINSNLNGGYNIFIDRLYDSEETNNKAIDQITKAIDFWRCNYYINFEIVTDPLFADASIRMENIGDPCIPGVSMANTLMIAPSQTLNCDENTPVDSPVLSFEIQINQEIADGDCFQTNPNTGQTERLAFHIGDQVPAPELNTTFFDFQRTMILELGHILQLTHTNNPEDIMYVLEGNTANNFNRKISPNDELGAEHVFKLSKLEACGSFPMIPYSCGTTHVEENVVKNNTITVYPNPSEGYFHLAPRSKINIIQYEIISLNGIVIHKEGFGDIVPEKIDIPKSVKKGTYFLRFLDVNGDHYSSTINLN